MAYLTGQILTQADIAALFTSGTYTPTLANMVIGTGGTPINTAKFTFVGFPAGGVLTVEGRIKFGTTGTTLPGASVETISLPSGYALIDTSVDGALISQVVFQDVSAPGTERLGIIVPVTSTTVRPVMPTVTGSFLFRLSIDATNPFTWAINDEFYYRYQARCTGP